MDKIRIYFVLMLWTVLQGISGPEMLAGSYTHSVVFDPSLISVKEAVYDGVTYTEVSYVNLESGDETGYPALPNNVVWVSVPNNSSAYKISSSGTYASSRTLTAPVLPRIEDVEIGSDYTPVPTPNTTVYNSTQYYPTSYARIVGEQIIGGFNKVVAVEVYPCRYAPKSNLLRNYNKVSFTLSWTEGTKPASNIHIPVFEDRVTRRITELESRVVNPASVRANANLVKDYFLPAQDKVGSEEDWFYLIVTTAKLAPAFERLAALRRMKGYPSHIITIEEVLSDPKYKDGDLLSNVNDDAGKLRAFLTDAHDNHGTEYVLLAGRYPEMPVRTYERPYKDSKTQQIRYETTTTDLYFSELTAGWVLDEKHSMINMDEINYSSQLKTGRLNCSNVGEVHSYIDKVIIYEFNPGNGDPSYLSNAFVTISTQMEAAYDRYGAIYKKIFKNIEEHRQYELNCPTPEEIIDALNQSNWGFVDFRGHGRPEGISMNDDKWTIKHPEDKAKQFLYQGLIALDGYDYHHAWNNQGCGRGIDLWENRNYPNWSHSMSCSTNPMINYDEEPYTFAESYVLGDGYGGVAFYGNTGPGFISMSDNLQAIFFDRFYNTYIDGSLPIISTIGRLTEDEYYRKGSKDAYKQQLILHHTLQGDPMIQLWLDTPHALTITDEYVAATHEDVVISRVDLQTGLCRQCPSLSSNSLSKENTINATNVVFGATYLPVILPTQVLGEVCLSSPCTHYMTDLLIGDRNESRTTLSWKIDKNLVSSGIISLSNVLIRKDSNPVVQSPVLKLTSDAIILDEGTEIAQGVEIWFGNF